MPRITAFAFCLLSFSWITQLTEAKWVKGTVDTSSKWNFITRFCFLTESGTLSYEFHYPVAYGTQEVLMYYDTPGQWDAVYNRGKTCDEMYSVLSSRTNQIIALNTSNTQTSSFSGCKLYNRLGATWYNCTGDRSFRSSRERWWYIVFARCGTAKSQVSGIYMDYTIHMTNGNDLLHQEYSADEFYILPVDMIFLILYVIVCTLSGICAVKLRNRQLFHTTYKIYLLAVAIWSVHLVIRVVAWGYYGMTGWELQKVEVTGRFFREFSNIVFILMLILMATGYTITRGALTKGNILKITMFMTAFLILTVVLFIWEAIFFDPGKVLYYYESPPGYCMVSLRLIGWLWFAYATVFTLKHVAKKVFFYIPFFSFFTVWFWAGPLVILVAMFVMPKWGREKTVNGVEQFIGFLGHVFFLIQGDLGVFLVEFSKRFPPDCPVNSQGIFKFLTRPNAANSNFPYHIRTSQIDALNNEDYVLGDQNPYFISGRADFTGTGPNLEFFITAKDNSFHYDEGDRMHRPLDAEFFTFTEPPPPGFAVNSDLMRPAVVSVHGRPDVSPMRQSTTTSSLATMINSDVDRPLGHLVALNFDVLPPVGFTGHVNKQS